MKTKQKTEKVFELESSRTSANAYFSIFDVVGSRQTCIYSLFVNLVMVDISQTTPEHDPYINNKTGPFMAFFNVHGECESILGKSKIGKNSYIRSVKALIGNPTDSRNRYAKVDKGLGKLEELVREEYLKTMSLLDCEARAAKAAAKKTRTLGSGKMNTMSKTKSCDAIRAEQLKEYLSKVGDNITTIQSDIDELVSSAVGCEGCAVCKEKARIKAAAAVKETGTY